MPRDMAEKPGFAELMKGIKDLGGFCELLRRLEQFYGEPVLPLGNFCHAMELWMDCIVKNNTDPALIQESVNHRQKYFESLKFMRIDIRKSNLLGPPAVCQGTTPH